MKTFCLRRKLEEKRYTKQQAMSSAAVAFTLDNFRRPHVGSRPKALEGDHGRASGQ